MSQKERKVLSMEELNELDAQYKQEMAGKITAMYNSGYSFCLCWNFHRDSVKAWERVKDFDASKCPDFEYARMVRLVQELVVGLYIKEEFGKETILVALNVGAMNRGYQGRPFPTQQAIDALGFLGLVPVKNRIKAMHFTSRREDRMEIVNYRFAEPEEVVAFL